MLCRGNCAIYTVVSVLQNLTPYEHFCTAAIIRNRSNAWALPTLLNTAAKESPDPSGTCIFIPFEKQNASACLPRRLAKALCFACLPLATFRSAAAC